MEKGTGSTNLRRWCVNLYAHLVGVMVVTDDLSAHLTPVVGEEDALTELQAYTGHAAKTGSDQLGVAVFARDLATVKPHRVARIRRQIDTVVVFWEGCWRLHRLDHA